MLPLVSYLTKDIVCLLLSSSTAPYYMGGKAYLQEKNHFFQKSFTLFQCHCKKRCIFNDLFSQCSNSCIKFLK